MASDFANFLIIYLVLIVMFSLVASFNFYFACEDFVSPFDSLITMIDASLGNYEFALFNKIED